MTDHAVVIVGGGPTGMMLAAELTLAGVDVAIVERRASSDLDGSRAGGLHSRSLEVLDQRGIVERFVSQGLKYPVLHAHPVALNIGDLPSRHNYTLALCGVVAHTVSSFGLHTDYHRASDEVSKVDFPFMTRSIHSMIKPIAWLANSNFKPAWLPGMAPTR